MLPLLLNAIDYDLKKAEADLNIDAKYKTLRLFLLFISSSQGDDCLEPFVLRNLGFGSVHPNAVAKRTLDETNA